MRFPRTAGLASCLVAPAWARQPLQVHAALSVFGGARGFGPASESHQGVSSSSATAVCGNQGFTGAAMHHLGPPCIALGLACVDVRPACIDLGSACIDRSKKDAEWPSSESAAAPLPAAEDSREVPWDQARTRLPLGCSFPPAFVWTCSGLDGAFRYLARNGESPGRP